MGGKRTDDSPAVTEWAVIFVEPYCVLIVAAAAGFTYEKALRSSGMAQGDFYAGISHPAPFLMSELQRQVWLLINCALFQLVNKYIIIGRFSCCVPFLVPKYGEDGNN